MPQRLKGDIRKNVKVMAPHDLKNEIEFESFDEFIDEFNSK